MNSLYSNIEQKPQGLAGAQLQAQNRQSEMTSAMSSLISKCESLEKSVNALLTKITPVCRPSTPASDQPVNAQPPFSSALANAIATQTGNIFNVMQMVDDAIERVEL